MDSQFVFVDRCRKSTQPGVLSSARRNDPSDLQNIRRNNFRQRVRCKLKTSPSRLPPGQVRLEQTACTGSRDDVEPVDEDEPGIGNADQMRTRVSQPDVENCSDDNRTSERLAKRRTSLHGKTITVRISRNETKYRKFQAQTYNFLERPKSLPSIVYHVLVFASVFSCLILSVLSTIQEYTMSAGRILLYMELGILFWFFTEYCIRLWSAGCRSRYQTWRGRIQFARRPFCIVDIIVIVASVVVLAVDSDRNMFAASALRGLRFFQILRMIRMDRRGGSFKLLASVVWAHRQELFTTVYIGFLGLIFSSFLIYLVEKKENEKIRTYADALWWGVVTLCTVGYGDTVPRTWIGKIIAAFCSLAGISFFALPAGILGSGFALKVQQHQRQKHLIRRRVPAATLIQCLWRCYAADPHSSSVATWKIHMRPVRKPVCLTASSSMIERGGFSRFGRFSTLKRRPDKTHQALATPIVTHQLCEDHKQIIFDDSLEDGSTGPKSAPVLQTHCDVNNLLSLSGKLDDTMISSVPAAICFIYIAQCSLLYFTPIIVIGYHEAVVNLHGASAGAKVPCEVTVAPLSRLRQTVPQLSDPHCSATAHCSGSFVAHGLTGQSQPVTRNESHRTNWSANQYPTSSTEKSPAVMERQLTEREKMAIRSIRKMRFLVARRKFREALRPYDVKDVIEQYSAGHLDMLTRVKILQSRLDQILGRQGSKTEDVYDSHQSLASRIVKIEHKVMMASAKLQTANDPHKNDQHPINNAIPWLFSERARVTSLADYKNAGSLNYPAPVLCRITFPPVTSHPVKVGFFCFTTLINIFCSFLKAPLPFTSANFQSSVDNRHRKSDVIGLALHSSRPMDVVQTKVKQNSWDATTATRPELEQITNLSHCPMNAAPNHFETRSPVNVPSSISTRTPSLHAIHPLTPIPNPNSPQKAQIEFDEEFMTPDETNSYPATQLSASEQQDQCVSYPARELIGWINQLPIHLPESLTESIDRTGPDDEHET
ncbi:Potassium voltage-gated channel subfamily KQT member 5 [Fasciola gigantica]|uniref:Potassium voltage-gated channel subfamily KQT member 5 n=1 Tax=Fasciola gigantica TaxID=46835 RepID=A0A504YWW7_FASGI|nr:Potassium voltage-gated channel subfamily KQT member 5 [Fasciola gigantica]